MIKDFVSLRLTQEQMMNTRQNTFYLVTIVAFAMFCSCCLTGCGTSADSLTRKQINLMNQLADAYESGASEKAIEKISNKMEVVQSKLNSLDISMEEKLKLGQKYQEEVLLATQRLLKAAMKHTGDGMPGFLESMNRARNGR